MKTILALDLGTTTGWAYRDSKGVVTAGRWVLQKADTTAAAAKLRRDRTLDPRIPILYNTLKHFWCVHATNPPDWPINFIVWEDVQFSRFTLQTQLWASFRTVVWLFCHNHSIPRDCCPVGTLKKFATGCGRAHKDGMIEAATRLFPGVYFGGDDNAADALCLLSWGIDLLKRAPVVS
jgi:Holliday junction resolvasome RuvABC endonuclease subunit